MDELDAVRTQLAKSVSGLAQLTADIQRLTTLVGSLNEERVTEVTERDDARATVRTVMAALYTAWTSLKTLRQQTEALSEARPDVDRTIARLLSDMRAMDGRNGA